MSDDCAPTADSEARDDSEKNLSARAKGELRARTGMDLLQVIIERYYADTDELNDQVKRLHALRTRDEDARKRCLGATLLTTTNSSRIAAARALILNELKAMRPLVTALLNHTARVEMARQELHVFEAAERQIRRERSERDQRQLTPLTYDFVDHLFHKYGVDGSALSTLTKSDYDTIADVVSKRHAQVVHQDDVK